MRYTEETKTSDKYYLNCPRCEVSIKLKYFNQFTRCPICHLKAKD